MWAALETALDSDMLSNSKSEKQTLSNLSVAVSASGDQTLSLGDEGGIAPEGLCSLVESCLQIPGMGVGGGGPGPSQGITKGKEQHVRIKISCMAMSNPCVRIALSSSEK